MFIGHFPEQPWQDEKLYAEEKEVLLPIPRTPFRLRKEVSMECWRSRPWLIVVLAGLVVLAAFASGQAAAERPVREFSISVAETETLRLPERR